MPQNQYYHNQQNSYGHSSGNPIRNSEFLPKQFLTAEQVEAMFKVSLENHHLNYIANTDIISDEIIKKGGIIYFEKPNQGHDLQEGYEENQQIINSQASFESGKIRICNSLHGASKYTYELINNYGGFNSSGLKNNIRNLDINRTRYLLDTGYQFAIVEIIKKTPYCNKFKKAGLDRDLNLGTPSEPLILNKDNALSHLNRLSAIVDDKLNLYTKPFMIIPTDLWELINFSNSQINQNFINKSKELTKNVFSSNLAGNTYILLNNSIPRTRIGTGKKVYTIICGAQKEFLFKYARIDERWVEMPDTWARSYQTKYRYGGGIINPLHYAIAYITIDMGNLI